MSSIAETSLSVSAANSVSRALGEAPGVLPQKTEHQIEPMIGHFEKALDAIFG
jgi:hypothetical protein